MRNNRDYLLPVSGKAELDPSRLPGVALIEICGQRQVLIENHAGVRAYDTLQVLVNIKGGYLCVCGESLRLCFMSRERLVIRGKIHSISFGEMGV